MFTLIAHRGASKEAPENTLSAFKRAVEIGVDAIECDVHLSNDGVPVVVHDAYLGRTTQGLRTQKIQSLTLEEIRALDAGHWFHSDFAGERISTLEEILALEAGKTGWMIELKKGHSSVKEMAQAISRTLQNVTHPELFWVGSFVPEILLELRALSPQLNLLGIAENMRQLEGFEPLNLPLVAVWYKLLTTLLVNELHSSKKKVWAFTVDDLRTAKFLLSIGVDGLITNDPRLLLPLKG